MIRQQVQQPRDSPLASTSASPSVSSLLATLRESLTAASLREQFAGLPAALYAITIQSGVYYYWSARARCADRPRRRGRVIAAYADASYSLLARVGSNSSRISTASLRLLSATCWSAPRRAS